MKTVYVMRHAQAKDHSLFVNDKDRKLTNTGMEQAATIAQKLNVELTQPIDTIITSNATRTLMTTKIIKENISVQNIIQQALLYNAPVEIFYEVLLQLPKEYNNILIVAHNPGITHFVKSLNVAKVDNMPTSAVFGCAIDCKSWLEIVDAKKEFLYFDYPKLH